METLFSISKDEALPIGLWPVLKRHAVRAPETGFDIHVGYHMFLHVV